MVNLDKTPGTVTGKQIAAMHRAPKLRGCPPDLRHECVQTAAATVAGVDSITDLSADQASQVLRLLGYGELKPLPRTRPARRPAPGTIRLATAAHQSQIRRLAREAGMGDQDLHWYLKHTFRIDVVRTARDAGRVIAALKAKGRRRDPCDARDDEHRAIG